MGCDIHCYVEYKEPHGWNGFGGRINPGRNYEVFGNLAGVRTRIGNPLIAAPRGMPDDAAYEARDDNRLWIVAERTDESGCCTREQAEGYVAGGYSEWTSEDKKAVTHPDHHSHSWVTPDEWERAITGCEWGPSPEYRALLAAMRALESEGHDVRVVFWFDN